MADHETADDRMTGSRIAGVQSVDDQIAGLRIAGLRIAGLRIAGVRLTPHGPLVFCHSDQPHLARGERVRVAVEGEIREGTVALAPDQMIAAPPLPDAPRIVETCAVDEVSRDDTVPADLVFLPAADNDVGPGELAQALELAAQPIPEPPPERR